MLIACVWLLAQVAPAPPSEDAFVRACNTRCIETHDSAYCTRYCDCALAELESRGQLGAVFSPARDTETDETLREVSRSCTEATDAEQRTGSGND